MVFHFPYHFDQDKYKQLEQESDALEYTILLDFDKYID